MLRRLVLPLFLKLNFSLLTVIKTLRTTYGQLSDKPGACIRNLKVMPFLYTINRILEIVLTLLVILSGLRGLLPLSRVYGYKCIIIMNIALQFLIAF